MGFSFLCFVQRNTTCICNWYLLELISCGLYNGTQLLELILFMRPLILPSMQNRLVYQILNISQISKPISDKFVLISISHGVSKYGHEIPKCWHFLPNLLHFSANTFHAAGVSRQQLQKFTTFSKMLTSWKFMNIFGITVRNAL